MSDSQTIEILVNRLENEKTTINVPSILTLNELKRLICNSQKDRDNTEFTIFQKGEPLEKEQVELQNGEEIVVVYVSKYQNKDINLFEKTDMTIDDSDKEEQPLTEEEMMQVFNHLTQQQKDDILILSDIGFDQQVAVVAYCMCAGNKEVAVNMLLTGEIAIDMRIITQFMCKKFPNAVREVRPALLNRRRNITTNNEHALGVEDLLFRALLNGGRLEDILNGFRIIGHLGEENGDENNEENGDENNDENSEEENRDDGNSENMEL
ncbi:hypothetical protein KM1_187670 [Entamoeba histolytica HM-3:IMSS]|uniref:UBA domain-containing protein n=1 Tax=Entamoeba histolytica HM-3:IMSS TaxID=885315 RepID=M7VXE4_ENTHI|nr:hypothetical protein KM1_187670 [Entamoeba histolytica HM-3:IMSS]